MLTAAYLFGGLSAGPESSTLRILAEPMGVGALTYLADPWTHAEQNTRLIGLQGLVLWNRLLWIALAGGMLAFGADRKPLYLARHRIRSGRQAVTVVVPRRPIRAGVDPYNKLIARNADALGSDVNIAAVTID